MRYALWHDLFALKTKAIDFLLWGRLFLNFLFEFRRTD